jgi:hypothetical protein
MAYSKAKLKSIGDMMINAYLVVGGMRISRGN